MSDLTGATARGEFRRAALARSCPYCLVRPSEKCKSLTSGRETLSIHLDRYKIRKSEKKDES